MIDLIVLLSDKECNLEKILFSIMMQTISDKLNVLIINSCSYDKLDNVVNKFSKKISINVVDICNDNSSIDIIHKTINNTKSDYLMFLKSNFLFFDCFAVERLYKKIVDSFYDIVSGNIVEYLGADNFKEIFSLRESVFCKIFSKKFVLNNMVKFNDSKLNEDFSFFDQCKVLSARIYFIEDKICLCNKLEFVDRISFIESYVKNVFWVVENTREKVEKFKISIYLYDKLTFLYRQYYDYIIDIGIDKMSFYIKRLELLYNNYN